MLFNTSINEAAFLSGMSTNIFIYKLFRYFLKPVCRAPLLFAMQRNSICFLFQKEPQSPKAASKKQAKEVDKSSPPRIANIAQKAQLAVQKNNNMTMFKIKRSSRNITACGGCEKSANHARIY